MPRDPHPFSHSHELIRVKDLSQRAYRQQTADFMKKLDKLLGNADLGSGGESGREKGNKKNQKRSRNKILVDTVAILRKIHRDDQVKELLAKKGDSESMADAKPAKRQKPESGRKPSAEEGIMKRMKSLPHATAVPVSSSSSKARASESSHGGRSHSAPVAHRPAHARPAAASEGRLHSPTLAFTSSSRWPAGERPQAPAHDYDSKPSQYVPFEPEIELAYPYKQHQPVHPHLQHQHQYNLGEMAAMGLAHPMEAPEKHFSGSWGHHGQFSSQDDQRGHGLPAPSVVQEDGIMMGANPVMPVSEAMFSGSEPWGGGLHGSFQSSAFMQHPGLHNQPHQPSQDSSSIYHHLPPSSHP